MRRIQFKRIMVFRTGAFEARRHLNNPTGHGQDNSDDLARYVLYLDRETNNHRRNFALCRGSRRMSPVG